MDITNLFLIQTQVNDIKSGVAQPYTEIIKRQVLPESYHYDYLERTDIPPFGSRITIFVTSPRDLKRNIIKSDSAYLHIPAAEVEQPAGTGRYSTIGGLLDDVITSLENSSAFAPSAVMQTCINRLFELKSGNKPFKIILNDPLSGSEVEEWMSDELTGKVFIEKYPRTWDDMVEYGLTPTDNLKAKDEEAFPRIVELVKNSSRIAALTGAGISTEAGIPAYRNVEGDGIWNIYSLEDEEINNFKQKEDSRINYWRMKYNLHSAIQNAKPTASHLFFSYLNKKNKLHKIVTQNIDGLHQAADVPMEKIIEIHGNTNTCHCMTCGHNVPTLEIYEKMRKEDVKVPMCHCGGFMHPNTISYGVPLDANLLKEAKECMSECDLLFVVGSSLVVQPVNSLPGIALAKGIPVVMVNIGETKYDDCVDYLVGQKAGESFAKLLELLEGKADKDRGSE
eukprot:Phypoly_transcript_08069.p1 GENE.Phypoly_transcript_08069~~Phypoly_transcript_08069.p1  ORF type:complete len:451 (+),score=60.53 Phypoly_transcript_08069:141-1493(+)